MSVYTKPQNKENVVIVALCRAKFRFQFPGHLKIYISKKWGFIKLNTDEFNTDGCRIIYISSHGLPDKW